MDVLNLLMLLMLYYLSVAVYHRVETTVRMRLLGLEKQTAVKPLNEEMACELGAEMLGEIIIFSICGVVLYFESARQAAKEKAKEDAITYKLNDLKEKTQDLGLTVDRQDAENRQLTRLVHHLESQLAAISSRYQPPVADSIPTVSPDLTQIETLTSDHVIGYRDKTEMFCQALMIVAACVLVYLRLSGS